MDVIHERVAGLDVHKATIVAYVRIMAGGKATRECRTFDTTTARGVAELADGERVHPGTICAVAASMLTAIYHILKSGTEHQDLGANHFDRRSVEIKAKRLAAQIAKLGYQVEIRQMPPAA
jgi:hypothetical protein